MQSKILVIDNFDSFTFNLAHLLEQTHVECEVVRNDEIVALDLKKFTHLVIGPGPGLPTEANNLKHLVTTWGRKPLLGVCLGMQFLLVDDGSKMINMSPVRHGAQEQVFQSGESPLFQSMPFEFTVGLYHSWGFRQQDVGSSYSVICTDRGEVVMGIEHKLNPWFGVQFHPESIMSEHGLMLIQNFLRITEKTNNADLQLKNTPSIAEQS